MPAWVKLMRESPTLLEFDPEERQMLQDRIGLLGRLRVRRIHRLISHESEDFMFLDGPDCSWLDNEVRVLRGGIFGRLGRILRGRGTSSLTGSLGEKLVELYQIAWPEPYKIRFLVARRNKGQRILSLSVLEVAENDKGLSDDAQADLSRVLGFFPRKFPYLRELKPARIYPEADVVLDAARTKELIDEIDFVLSESNPGREKVSERLIEELSGIVPVLNRAIKEGLFVWLSRA